MKKLITVESVTKGHPDKVCDQIADHILDAYLQKDPSSRVACEVCINKDLVLIMGEITSKAEVDIENIARKTILDIGYNKDELGFNGYNVPIKVMLNKQSSDIALGVDASGAGDQGMMYGYATAESANYMPLACNLANNLAKRLDEVRENNIIKDLRPDGKTQVTLEYNDHNIHLKALVISISHEETKNKELLRKEIIEEVINKVIPENLIDEETQIFINPTGNFVICGPAGDTGLTGRKIMVDTYGGLARHGGGAFSGKDYTKVDRSAAYYARYVAKNIIHKKLATEVLVSVSYAIGIIEPLQIDIETFNNNLVPIEEIYQFVNDNFDFKTTNVIKELDLKHVNYADTTMYSHFGKANLPWEQIKE